MALSDSAGVVVNTYDYDAFGAVRASTGIQANAFTFTGEQTDAGMGLEYLRARYYDAGTGRFISVDGLSGLPGLPSSQDPFLYVLNSPADLLDPSGVCVFGAPCPKPVKKVVAWVSGRAEDAISVAEYTVKHPCIVMNDPLLQNELLGGLLSSLSSCDREGKEGGCRIPLDRLARPPAAAAPQELGRPARPFWIRDHLRLALSPNSPGAASLRSLEAKA